MTNTRKRLEGVVIDAKMQKTIKVQVSRSYRHPLYGKVVHDRKAYIVHDELTCHTGDLVTIVESRPISKTKRWMVESIQRRAPEAQVAAEVADVVDEVAEESAE
jgi:small subunit ribosomal protein S17